MRFGARGERDAIEQVRFGDVGEVLGDEVDVVRAEERLDGALVRADARLQHAWRRRAAVLHVRELHRLRLSSVRLRAQPVRTLLMQAL